MGQEKNIIDVWNAVLLEIKNQLPDSTFTAWVLPLEPQYFDETTFVIHTGHSLATSILRNHMDCITQAVSSVVGRTLHVKIIHDEELEKKLAKKSKAKSFQPSDENTLPKMQYDSLTQMQSSNLNLKYKFENFVVGSNNKLAYVAAQTVAQKPGEKYNPLYIYGGPGLGKTHIMQAIGHYVIKNSPNLKVLFISAEEFVNDVVNSLASGMDKNDQTKKMNKFRKKYREVDVLLIDDIQQVKHLLMNLLML